MEWLLTMDDTMDTLDTSVDIRALEDAGDFDDVDATEQIPALEPEELDITALNSISAPRFPFLHAVPKGSRS